MNIVRKSVLSVLLVALVFVSLSCSKKPAEAGWKADIETVNGVKTVRNPAEPRYGEFTFELVEDLVIGEEKDETRFFPKGANLSVDGEGWLYVRDHGNKRIQVFDQNGKFLRSLGRIGQGPGEFSYPGLVMFDDENRPHVWAARSVVVFNRDGTFAGNRPLKASLNRLIMGPGSYFIGMVQPNRAAEGGPKNRLTQFGIDGEQLRNLGEYPVYGVSKDGLLMHWYTGWISVCRRLKDSLYYGFSLEETIHVVDAEGRPLFDFLKAEERHPISAEEAALTRKEGIFAWLGGADPEKSDLGMPDHRPYHIQYFSDDDGRLYVLRFKPITEKDDPSYKVDVFSKDGFYLYRMTWPFLPTAMKSGYFYLEKEDEAAGLYKVIRYKIANWADFRTE